MQEIGQSFFDANLKRSNVILVKVVMQLIFLHIFTYINNNFNKKVKINCDFLYLTLQHYKKYEYLQCCK